jgi:FAD/FMN-containing dehydrogenase
MTAAIDFQGLRSSLRGEILTPAHPEYDEARRVWNGMIDRRPDLIVRCAGPSDVIQSVNFARENSMRVAVRGGGHSFPGFSVSDGGMVIDLSRMRSVRVDPRSGTARAEGGAQWGDLDREAAAFGLAVTGGQISHTGIGGLTLGGGIGWLMRKFGTTADNLLSADVVTANGELLHADEHENEDLFWGLRGGGGNFGIVTSFEYRLHPVAMVYAGMVIYPLPQAVQVLRGFRELAATARDELTTMAAFLSTPEGHPGIAIGLCYAGDPAEGEALSQPYRELGTPVMEQMAPMPYTVAQSMMDPSVPPGHRYYMRSNLLNELSDTAIEECVAGFAKVPSPLSILLVVQMGGAVARVPREATAFVHRDSAFSLTVFGSWLDSGHDETNVAWVREVWDRLSPTFPERVYVNELHDEGSERVRAAYGPAYERLLALKRKYDPDNFFRLNQNIAP